MSQEYLVSDYLRTHPKLSGYAIDKKGTDQAQSKLAKLALKYLLLDDFSEPCTSDSQLHARVKKYRFYEYCATYWFEHTHNVKQEDGSLLELVDSFVFGSPGHLRCYEQMMKIIYYDSRHAQEHETRYLLRYNEEYDPDHQLSDAIFYNIIRQGLRWVTKGIIERRPELLNEVVQEIGPAIRIAILAGHEGIVRDLLLLGANTRQQCPPHDLHTSTPINCQHESIQEHWDTPCDILLKYRHKPQSVPCPIKDTPFEYPIHTVSQHIPKILPLFLQHGADDTNLRGGDGSTPIHYAVLGGSLDAIQTLVTAGGNINAETNGGRTALHIAVSLHWKSIIDYLLDHNVVIPPDITTVDLEQAVSNTDNSDDDDDGLKDAKKRLLEKIEKINAQSISRELSPPILNDWILTTVRREEPITINSAFDPPSAALELEPYVSIAVNGKSLKRIVFKIRSSQLQNNSVFSDCYNSYRRPYSWYETAIVRAPQLPNPNNENTTEPLTIPHNVDIVQRRHIQTNVHNSKSPRYHVVTWDVRNPTPGVKEWLDMIQPGDVIEVYPRTKWNWRNYVEMIEVEVYCEF